MKKDNINKNEPPDEDLIPKPKIAQIPLTPKEQQIADITAQKRVLRRYMRLKRNHFCK